jgi:hypothetical protein
VLLGAVAGAVEVFESKGGWGCEVASPLNMVCRTNGRIDEVLVTRPTAQVTRPPALTRSRMTGKFYGPKAVGPLGALAPPKHRRSDGSEVASCNLLCTPEYGVATQVQTTTQLTGWPTRIWQDYINQWGKEKTLGKILTLFIRRPLKIEVIKMIENTWSQLYFHAWKKPATIHSLTLGAQANPEKLPPAAGSHGALQAREGRSYSFIAPHVRAGKICGTFRCGPEVCYTTVGHLR